MKAHATGLLAGAILTVANLAPGLGGIIRHDRPVERYRELGKAAPFLCVGEVTLAQQPGARWRPSASAVLVAPQWVLTAGHVAAGAPLEAQRYRFGGEEYRALKRVVHPEADFETRGKGLAIAAEGADLALVQLDRAVRSVPPAERFRGHEEVGRTMTKIGYGCIGDGRKGMTLDNERPVQERRGGNNRIDAAGGELQNLTASDRVVLCDFDDPGDPTLNQFGEAKPEELEIGQSVGDSGGGWFIEHDGKWVLVAITSVLLPNKGEPRNTSVPKYGAVMAGMRVSKANDWIDGVIGMPPND